MLQQILKDMFIDPELLAELSEHQKQLLFVKMREEQVRRYDAREVEEKKNPPKKAPKVGKKNLDWLLGRDGQEWVWIMGEHKNDKTLDQILERENEKEAAILAQKEAVEKRIAELKKEEEEMLRKEKEEEEKRIKLQEEEERLKKQKERLEEEKRKAEKEAYASLKEIRLQKERWEKEEAEKKKKEEELRKKQEGLRKQREEESIKRKEREEQLRREEESRTEELYLSIKKLREEEKKVSMKEREKADEIFSRQLRESKKVDSNRRSMAKAARDEVRRSRVISQDLSNLSIQDLLDRKIIPMESPPPIQGAPVPPKMRQAPRPPKPKSHNAVVEWFQQEESLRNAGLLKDTMTVAPWFHGIITRQQAEHLLFPKERGHFLIRVSERVWGYALSYRDEDRAKHFLIDASGSTYSFFGQDQKSHDSLEELINFHMNTPITEMEKEVLKTACGQLSDEAPDYQELFPNQNTAL